MFVLNNEIIEQLSIDGFYDYLIDEEENGNISDDDKEDIYQFSLTFLQDNLNKESSKKFLLELNKMLSLKNRMGY